LETAVCAAHNDKDVRNCARHIARVLRERTDGVLDEKLPDEIAELLARLKNVNVVRPRRSD
jgi:hypothetical protein